MDISNQGFRRKHRPAADVLPERSEDPTGCYWKKLHHKKTNIKTKKGTISTGDQSAIFRGHLSSQGSIFFVDFLPANRGGEIQTPKSWSCQEGQLANSQPSPLPRPPKMATRQDWICRASDTKILFSRGKTSFVSPKQHVCVLYSEYQLPILCGIPGRWLWLWGMWCVVVVFLVVKPLVFERWQCRIFLEHLSEYHEMT